MLLTLGVIVAVLSGPFIAYRLAMRDAAARVASQLAGPAANALERHTMAVALSPEQYYHVGSLWLVVPVGLAVVLGGVAGGWGAPVVLLALFGSAVVTHWWYAPRVTAEYRRWIIQALERRPGGVAHADDLLRVMIQETLPARLEAPLPPDSRVSERGRLRSLVDDGLHVVVRHGEGRIDAQSAEL